MSYKKIEKVTDEFWTEKIPFSEREVIDDFLSQQLLSPATLKQYKSACRIFIKWVYDTYKGQLSFLDMKTRHARKYQDWLLSLGLSSKSIKFKRSVVSSLCKFVEAEYGEEYPDFRNFFTAVKVVESQAKKEKVPLTSKEFNNLIEILQEKGELQKVAYLLYTYSTGCRREETRQLRVEVADYDFFVNKKGEKKDYYETHMIRAKGRNKIGKVRTFTFDKRAMEAIRAWINFRKENYPDDKCEYVFATNKKDGFKQVAPNTFNSWCEGFSKLIGKKVHPHLIRTTRATIAREEEGIDIKGIQKLLGHNSSETTEIYIVRDDSEDLDDLY